MSEKPREFWIELWSIEGNGDTEVKNVFTQKPKHWPRKPVLQFHTIEKRAYDNVLAHAEMREDLLKRDIHTLKLKHEENELRWQAVLEDRDKLHAQHVQEIEARRLRVEAELEQAKRANQKYSDFDDSGLIQHNIDLTREVISLKRELEQAKREAGEYYHRGLNDRGDEVAAITTENIKLKQIIKDHDAKGYDCPDLEWRI